MRSVILDKDEYLVGLSVVDESDLDSLQKWAYQMDQMECINWKWLW